VHAGGCNEVDRFLQVEEFAAADAVARAQAEDGHREAAAAPRRAVPKVAVVLVHQLRPLACTHEASRSQAHVLSASSFLSAGGGGMTKFKLRMKWHACHANLKCRIGKGGRTADVGEGRVRGLIGGASAERRDARLARLLDRAV
jgi:hypothetical protein